MKTPKKVLLAVGTHRDEYKEISIDQLVEEYDYSYYCNFMERWARDAVSNWVSTDDDHQKEFVREYLKLAHSDLIVDEP